MESVPFRIWFRSRKSSALPKSDPIKSLQISCGQKKKDQEISITPVRNALKKTLKYFWTKMDLKQSFQPKTVWWTVLRMKECCQSVRFPITVMPTTKDASWRSPKNMRLRLALWQEEMVKRRCGWMSWTQKPTLWWMKVKSTSGRKCLKFTELMFDLFYFDLSS